MREKLNWFHVAILTYMIQLDVTLFSLPRIIAEKLGTNGWIGVLLLSLVGILNIFLYSLVHRMGKGASFFDIVEASLPKFMIYPLYLALALFYIYVGSILGKSFIIIFQIMAFPTTNSMFLFLLYCYMMYCMLIKDIYSISKAVTVFFFVTFWLGGLTFYYFSEWEIVRLTPFLFKGATEEISLNSWTDIYTIFVGCELCLYLFPYASRDGKWFKGVYIGHIFITLVYVYVIIVSSGFFSFHQLKAMSYPIIDSLAFIELPFINRVENLVFAFFMFSNVTSSVIYGFASLSAMKRIFPRMRKNVLEFVIAGITFGFGFTAQILRETDKHVSDAMFVETILAFSIPLLLIVLLLIQRLRLQKGSERA
ncbi:GerAB/ArcD/ProY family transporter [Brevibacillus dissolubilis]|uniref:GerAB/ArcD/ProY family transporter n=1 Tax=Brevibacillus dissolubilis TaxID=1844116 RepID=UPI001116B892|nr:GerAB/ArcD/ProY family transporter [Brevibacillus dissolubilis]